jgi:bile acid:Na+ symporter, BASS family
MFVAICFAIGWVLGGPGADTRGVLSLGTAQRNTAAALVVAGQNFTDAKVVVMITVVMIISFVVLMPLARVLAGRQHAVGVRTSPAAAR